MYEQVLFGTSGLRLILRFALRSSLARRQPFPDIRAGSGRGNDFLEFFAAAIRSLAKNRIDRVQLLAHLVLCHVQPTSFVSP